MILQMSVFQNGLFMGSAEPPLPGKKLSGWGSIFNIAVDISSRSGHHGCVG